MVSGTVKWFDSRRGFGFIAHEGTEGDIFVHFSSIEGEGFRCLRDGEVVEFELTESAKGFLAQNVRRVVPATARQELGQTC